MVTPIYPATNNQQAIDLNISNANQFFTILQGGIEDFIPTYEGNGEIPSVAKALNEAAAYKVPLPWQTTGEETDLLQPREFNDDIYVPLTVPAEFSTAPSNEFWRLYSEKRAQVLIDNITLTGDGFTTDFNIPSMVVDDPAAYLVSIDGVDQRPTIDYTVDVSTDTLSFTEAPPTTVTDNISVTIMGALRGAIAEEIYADTTDGLANTSDGQFFNVVNTSDPEAFIDLYRNNAGAALLIDTYPNSVAYSNLVSVVEDRVIRRKSVAGIEALAPSTDYQVSLSGPRAGIFEFDSSDLSTEVTADTQQGVYIAPSSDSTGASGAWVRQYSGPVNVRWFGALGNGVNEDSAAINKAIAFVEDGAVYIPAGFYLITDTINVLDGVVFEGDGYGSDGTHIQIGADVVGVLVRSYSQVKNFKIEPIVAHTKNNIDVGTDLITGQRSQICDIWTDGAGQHGISVRNGNLGVMRDIIALSNGSDGINFTNETADNNAWRLEGLLDLRGNGRDGLHFQDGSTGSPGDNDAPKTNSVDYAVCQANGRYGIYVGSRGNVITAYLENNGTAPILFSSASAGNDVTTVLTTAIVDNGVGNRARGRDGAFGMQELLPFVSQGTQGFKLDNTGGLLGSLEWRQTGDAEFTFTLADTNAQQNVIWTNLGVGGTNYIFDEGGITTSDNNGGITNDPLASKVKLRLEDKDTTKAVDQESGTIEWFTNDAGNEGVQAAIWVRSSPSGVGTMEMWSGSPGTLTPLVRLLQPSSSSETGMFLYDFDTGTIQRVTVGAADSGGTGFKVLRIPN